MYIRKLHRITGIVISVFLFLHIINHMSALAGPSFHVRMMNYFRHIYRFPPIEVLLLLSLAFQITSGITLILRKGFNRQPWFKVVQILSGLYLSFFIVLHLGAVFSARYRWNIETDYYFAARVAVHPQERMFFIPYYTFSLLAVFSHLGGAHYIIRMEQLQQDVTVLTRFYVKKYRNETIAIFLAGLAITLLIMISFTGVLHPLE